MRTQHSALSIVLAAAMLSAPVLAKADSTTSLTGMDIGFTSPGQIYGPWHILDLRSSNKTPGQAVNWELALRSDRDRPYATHGLYGSAGYVKDLTDRVYAFVNFGAGSSGLSPLPAYDGHVELGYKVSTDRRLVLNVAEDRSGYTHGITSNELLVGPTYYAPGYVFQARYTVSANTGSATRSGGLAALDVYTSRKRSKVSVAVQFGPQSYESYLPNAPIASGDFRGTTVNVDTTQWVTNQVGFTVGAQYAHLTNLQTGGPLYTARGVSLGVVTRH